MKSFAQKALLITVILCVLPTICLGAEFTSEVLSKTFFNAIANNEHLNITLAKAILAKFSEDHEFIGLVAGTTPVLHHLVNLFMFSRSLIQRSGIVELIHQVVALGANVNEPYNADPPLVFKTLVMKEFNLTKVLIEKTDFQSLLVTKSHWLIRLFSNLYAVPGEPVPYAKLLLHVDTIVRAEPEAGLEGVKFLLASASMGIDAKATLKQTELIADSETYNTLLTKLGSEGGNSVSLADIQRSLDELSSKLIHKSFLAVLAINLANAPAVVAQDAASYSSDNLLEGFVHAITSDEIESEKKRSALHGLCLSSGALMLDDLTAFLSGLPDTVSATKKHDMFAKLGAALLSRDIRGHSPVSYAVMRYGPESAVATAAIHLLKLLNVDYADHIAGVVRFLGKEAAVSSVDGSAGVSVDDIAVKVADVSLSGGWAVETHSAEELLTLGGAIGGSTSGITEVVGSALPTNKEFFERFVNTGTPVVFRGAASKTVKKVLAKERFLKKYGDFVVPSAAVPFPDSFGLKGTAVTLKQVVEAQATEAYVRQFSIKTDSSANNSNSSDSNNSNIENASEEVAESAAPPYTFCTPSRHWSAALLTDIPIPRCLTKSLTDESVNSGIGSYVESEVDSSASPAWQFEIQFYLGGVGTGAPVHFHGHAINTLAYGEKKWFLYPPSESFYSTIPAHDFVQSLAGRASSLASTTGFTPSTPIVVTQRAGDVLYVPALWGHATINTQQSVGVAHEFSVESFCME